MASIADIRSTNDPQRAYEFEVTLTGGSTSGNLPIMTQRVMNVNIPETSLEQIEINYKSRKTMYAGRDASPHTMSITFWDTEGSLTYNYFRDWIAGISSFTDGSGSTRDAYAAELIVTRLAADSSTPTGINRLTKVWPTTVGELALSYESSEHMTFDVTFSYDENLPE